ncbi:MAG TPA: zf-HC2 domain-containing protein [Actinomycetes bacterium]|nr:zf-HC2 domain-containing protein [Actinomycetes bacterium]
MSAEELTCQEVVEILNDYLEGVIAPDDRLRLEEHLMICEGCRNSLAQLETTMRLTGGLTEETVPAEVMAPLLEAFRGWRRE